MSELILERPSEKQRLFMLDTHKYIGYGGARGGGKSWAVRNKAVLLCYKYPGIKVLIVRKTYPELWDNHIEPLIKMLKCYQEDPQQRLANYNDQKKFILFPNGSKILFRFCDTDKDADRFQGIEVDVLFIDEATQQSEARIQKLSACVRGVNPFPKRVCYTMNPGGEGHNWAKRLFIEQRYLDNEDPANYSFIQSLVTDNEALMKAQPDYVKQLEALPPKLRDAWLYGNWDVYEGQFFEDFLIKKHVIEPFDLNTGEKKYWKIIRSYDFGYHHPFSCGWTALSRDGTMYRILEYYGCTGQPNEGVRMSPDQQFREIAEIERTHPWLKDRKIEGVADPSIWDGSRGESIADTAAKYGLFFLKGVNDRIPGWMQCHYRLQLDENDRARFYVFDNCKEFIRTIPLLQYSAYRPEDLDTEGEDHIADEWRYACMAYPILPVRPVVIRRPMFNDPLSR